MKTGIIKYFLKWLKMGLIITSIPIVLKTFTLGEFTLNDFKVASIIIIIGAALISVLCGVAEYYFYEIYKPRKIKKILMKKEFQELETLGFKIESDENYFTNFIKNYCVTILPDISGDNSRWVYITAYILPEENQYELLEKLPKDFELDYDENLIWLNNKIRIKWFKYPDIDRFRSEIDKLLNFLIDNNIKPIEFKK